MQTNSKKQYFIIALLLSLAIGLTIHFPMIMSYLFGEQGQGHGDRGRIPEFKSWFGD